MKAVLIKSNGECSLSEKDHWDYKQLGNEVGGWIECVPLKNNGDMYVNEEGKLIGLPVNDVATLLADHFGYKRQLFDLIVGDVVILGPANNEGENTEVTNIIIDYLKGKNLL